MTIEECFEVQIPARIVFIDENIVAHLPEKDRSEAKKRATTIVEAFVGRDMDALSVLSYAAERGKFCEYAEKLENHFQESMKYVHPEARRIAQIPGAVRAERFFLDCYKEMEIKPSGN